MNSAELKNVSYVYSRGTPFEKKAVKNVSVSFEKGKITGIIGHTGSGKSTLAQLINGLLEVSEGEVYVDGKDIWQDKKNIKNVRFKVGLVFQYPEYQLFEETVYKDIAFGPKNMGLGEEEIDIRVKEAAKEVGLDETLLDKSPFDLSGGQKRRAAIAGVIAMRPEMLILDEPAAGLDPRGRESIMNMLSAYCSESGASVVMISHSMEDIARYCDDILVMNKGEVYFFGSTADVFAFSEQLSLIGLAVPQVTMVLMELKKLGFDVSTSAYTVDDAEKEIERLLGGDVKC